MKRIEEALVARENKLQIWKDEKEKALLEAPDGSLRVNTVKGNVHYYHRTDPKDFKGRYIRKENASLIKDLAQKEYDKKILRSVEEELKAISYYFSKTNHKSAEQIYETMHKEKQRLISPIEIPKEQYIQEWQEKNMKVSDLMTEWQRYIQQKVRESGQNQR